VVGARDEMEAQRARAQTNDPKTTIPNKRWLQKTPKVVYKRPDDRNRETGSANGSAWRRKIQRATANPTAA